MEIGSGADWSYRSRLHRSALRRDLLARVFFAGRVHGSSVAQRSGGRRGSVLGGARMHRAAIAHSGSRSPSLCNRKPISSDSPVESDLSSKGCSLGDPLAPSALSLAVPSALPTASPAAFPPTQPLLLVWVIRCDGFGRGPGFAVGRC